MGQREVESPTGRPVVDVRFPAPWIFEKRFKGLSGDATKLFLFGYGYSVFNELEGRIPDDDLPDIPGVNLACVQELERAGLWTRDGSGWLLARYSETQSTLAELAAAARARIAARDRKARQRVREKGEDDAGLMSRVTPQERRGKDRTGVEGGTPNTQQQADEGWPDVAPVGAGSGFSSPNVKDTSDWPGGRSIPGQRVDDPPPKFGIFDRMAKEADASP
ncbi:hypothetical protein K1W54_29780 [Micromonospora sp. CPCC 205371]|nr:hypothetical protein [Micromonospora sp. CPCC 205371]